jgi:hypothetical protein
LSLGGEIGAIMDVLARGVDFFLRPRFFGETEELEEADRGVVAVAVDLGVPSDDFNGDFGV